MATREKYLELIETIQKHDFHYYSEAKPTISDYEYDHLVKEVEKIENEHPKWVVPFSPTQRVGEMPSDGFTQVNHSVPMLSLSNTYSREEVEDFLKRVQKNIEKNDVKLSLELKMDGTAVSIRYEKGILVRGVTRGNGKRGDDITQNIKTIATLPLKLKGKEFPAVLEIRGEVFLPEKKFIALNEERQEAGEAMWANPRNAAAGSLKLLDSKEVAKRGLDIVCYGVVEGGEKLTRQSETHSFLKEFGLPVCDDKHVKTCTTIEEIFVFIDQIQSERSKLPFEIDGIVLKVDELKYHDLLGATGKSPRWATSYKFPPDQATTEILDITIQVGRTGVLTPVAELKPVLLSGSTISRATLHNEEEIERKDIRIGDTVVIEKGGDVIPKVVSVDLSKRKSSSKKWKMVEICPMCHSKTIKREGEVATRCSNTKDCPGQNLRRIIYFASKNAMNIENLGVKVIEKLVSEHLITTISDIYSLQKEDLLKLDGFKEKSAQNIIDSIEKSKDIPFARFLFSLGIPFVGTGVAELLAENARTLERLQGLSKENLLEIDGIGEKAADSIVNFFADSDRKEEVNQLLQRGVAIQPMKPKLHGHVFSEKTFVLTGTLQNYSRKEASDLIKERNGKVTGTVSKKTDFLLVGSDAGSKLEKARKLDIEVLSEDVFEKML